MELPEGFTWQKAATYTQAPDMICLKFVCVARIQQRVDDLRWQAFLDFHLDHRQHIVRPCRNQWTGRDGMELWVIRHQDRLREEVAAIIAEREAGKIGPAE